MTSNDVATRLCLAITYLHSLGFEIDISVGCNVIYIGYSVRCHGCSNPTFEQVSEVLTEKPFNLSLSSLYLYDTWELPIE